MPAALVVTDAGDAGPNTLRGVMATADANGEDDTITFSGVSVINLTTGQISLTGENNSLTISGAGVTINGSATASATNRIFSFNVSGGNPTITLTGLTLAGGSLTSGNNGGAILVNNDPLVLSGVTFSGNKTAGTGGAIASTAAVAANISADSCTFSGNSATSTGGAISGTATITLTITNSSFTGNTSGSTGGGVHTASAATTVVVTDSTFANNKSTGNGAALSTASTTTITLNNSTFTGNTGSNGGVIRFNSASPSVLTVNSCTMTGNTSSGRGGAVYSVSSGTINVNDSTIAGNTSNGNGGGIGVTTSVVNITNSTISGNTSNGTSGGGGIYTTTGVMTIRNTTIAFNTAVNAGGLGGGIRKTSATGTLTLNSTIVAANGCTGVGGEDMHMTAALTVSGGDNLIGVGDVGNFMLSGTNLTGTDGSPLDPQLAPLAKNGGPTTTHELLGNSPAVNMGNNVGVLMFDQRGSGFPRVLGGTADVGSFERDPSKPFASTTLTDITTPGGIVYVVTVKYQDDVGIATGDIDVNDVVLSGPAFGAPIAPTTAMFSGGGTLVTATYEFTPPGGAWDALDSGLYTVSIVANQVNDTDGPNAVPAGPIGSFGVTMALPALVVDNTGDAADGNYGAGQFSLREALILSNFVAGVDSISFAPALSGKSITMGGTEFTITDPVNITGPGAKLLTIDAVGLSRIFNVNMPGTATVSLSGLTLANGSASGTGGAINHLSATSALLLNDCVFNGNFAGSNGGAINTPSSGNSTITITNSTFTNNTAGGSGGAVNGGSTVTFGVTSSTFTGNSAGAAGGALNLGTGPAMAFDSVTFNNNSAGTIGGGIQFAQVITAKFTNASFTGNSAGTGQGGGIAFVAAASTAEFGDVTFSQNKAGIQGGGISFAGNSTCTINNAIFSNNTGSTGGALFMSSQLSVTVTNSKFTGNISAASGGGGAMRFGGGTITLNTCTFDKNFTVDLGGAICSTTGPFLWNIDNCAFTNNTAQGSVGGAIASNANGTNMTINNSTFDNNSATSGGALYAITTLTLNFTNTKFTNNIARTSGGGAIRNGGGTITFTDVTFDHNFAALYGGAIGGTTGPHAYVLTRTNFTNNTSGARGGALAIETGLGTVTMTASTVANNLSATGGGIYLATNASLTLDNSTVSGNTATSINSGGGGIALYQGGGIITNSTISGNVSSGLGGGGIGLLYPLWSGSLDIRNTTITNNSAPNGTGGGIASPSNGGTISVSSTIVAGNTAKTGRDIGSLMDRAVGGDDNLIGGIVATNITLTGVNNPALVGSDASPVDPGLYPLQFNGGLTKTHALQIGSKALDQGNNIFALTSDQRADDILYPRVLGAKADIGAHEGVSVLPFATTVLTNVKTAGTEYVVTVVYEDETGVNVASIDTTDLEMTGPGFGSPAAPFKVTTTGSGTKVTADYFFTPPGGGWDVTDNGTYAVALVGTVSDTDGTPHNAVKAGLGTFTVGIGRNFVVDITADEDDGNIAAGDLSFREAMRLANERGFGSADTVSFDPAVFGTLQTITLSLGQISISDSVAINGPGANLLTIRADAIGRHFFIYGDGAVAVDFADLSLVDGAVTGDGGSMLVVDEAVSFSGVTLSNNKASGDGGAIQTLGSLAKVTLIDSRVVNNLANRGAGVSANSTTAITVIRSTVSGNTANDDGGGLYFFDGGSLLVERSTISGNTSNATSGNANLAGSGGGGGIYWFGKVEAGGFTISNSTIANNKTVLSRGGAITLQRFVGTAVIQNSTIANNDAKIGGGITLARPYTIPFNLGAVTLSSTIVAGNTVLGLPDPTSDLWFEAPHNVASNQSLVGLMDLGNNVTLVGVGNLTGDLITPLDAKLGALADNGGPTQTMALLAGSPALNTGNNLAGLATDQRGLARTSGAGTDMGAFEAQAGTPAKVTSVKIDDGSLQRSLIRSLTITFDQPVTLPGVVADAFTLTRQGGGAVTLAGTVNGAGTEVTLTFSGAETDFNSLKDGRYDFSIIASKVTTGGGSFQLDGNGDGTGGDNYVLNSAAAPANPTNVWRLFGDVDGDNDVDTSDFGQFRLAFGGGGSIFDFDNDGDTDTSDFGAFRSRFGASV